MRGRYRERRSPAEGLLLPRIADHESGVRSLIAESRGESYRPLRTLAEAKAVQDGVVVFEGDDGGQIYAVVPAQLVECPEEKLEKLLIDLDSREWDDPGSRRVFYERHPIGTPIFGGMGGGLVTDGVWVHPNLKHFQHAIEAVITGRAASVDEVTS